FMKARDQWSGNAKMLLEELDQLVDERTRRDPHRWPTSPEKLANKLRMIAPDLRAKGLEADQGNHRVWGSRMVRDGCCRRCERFRDGSSGRRKRREISKLSRPGRLVR